MGKNASVSVSATVYKTGSRQAVDVVVVQVALQVGEVASPRDWWGSQGSPAISPLSVHSSRPIFTPSQAFLASQTPKMREEQARAACLAYMQPSPPSGHSTSP
jgi:hypothetical protein